MPYTKTHANAILNWTFGKQPLPAFSKVYIGLITNDPEKTYKETGVETFNELSGGGYSRVLIGQYNNEYPGLMNSADIRAILNGKQINWTKATIDWDLVNGIIISSSSTVGETASIFFYGALELTEEQKASGGLLVEAGSVALFDPETLKIEFPAYDLSSGQTTK